LETKSTHPFHNGSCYDPRTRSFCHHLGPDPGADSHTDPEPITQPHAHSCADSDPGPHTDTQANTDT